MSLTVLSNSDVLLAGGAKMYDNNADTCNGKCDSLNSTYKVHTQSEYLHISSMAHGRCIQC